MGPRDESRGRRLIDEADETFVAMVGSHSTLAGGDLPAPGGWWRRRQLGRALEEELRVLGLRVALSDGGAILLDPALRRQAAQARALWSELHPAEPLASAAPTKDLLAAVDEMRRRLETLARALEAPGPRPRATAAQPPLPAAARRSAGRR
jgi:hypothetical protein